MPCTLVRLVQFSKVFVALTTTILVYHSHFSLSTGFLTFFNSYFHQPRYTHSPYGIRTRVTAVKRRCLNPLTNGPELFQLFLLYPLLESCQLVCFVFSEIFLLVFHRLVSIIRKRGYNNTLSCISSTNILVFFSHF